MHTKYPNLFSQIKIGSHTYKNRIIASPIYCGPFVSIPFLSDVLEQAIMERARGGCSQVTIGETPVDFESACKEPLPPIDYNNYKDPGFEKLKKHAETIKKYGAKALIEISHCGDAKVHFNEGEKPIGPMGYIRDDGIRIVAMDEELMQEVCDKFVAAAKFMKAAGYDGVLIHGGHGWLLHQFLSSRTNRRTDEYGGALENRAKFPVRVLNSVRNAMGRDFIIEVRVSGDECVENGMGIEETAEFCKMIENLVDMIHVSVGIYRDPILSGEFSSIFHPHCLNAEVAAVIKKAISIPVNVVGGINSPEQAEKLIVEGKSDLVALGRQLTADPDFANKAGTGNEKDIASCLRCYKCFPGALEDNIHDLSSLFGCTVNPEAFYFNKSILDSKPEDTRNVLVIGGGPAGMEAATIAADRGHKVTLIEKTGSLGGLLKFTDNDSYKSDLRNFKDLLVRRVQDRNINVILNMEATPEDTASFNADAVIIAVGSCPITLPIEGIENTIKALDAYDDISKVGKKVVIVGGGLVGCEAGLSLAKNGKDVTIIEMQDKVSPDSYPMHRIALINEMDKMLKYRTGLKCTSIAPNGITVTDRENKEEFIPADTVIYALGMRANKEAAEKIRTAVKGASVFEIGDCVRPAKVYDALREAFVAAMSIL